MELQTTSMNERFFLVPPDGKIKLSGYPPDFTGAYKKKEEAQSKLVKDVDRLAELQDVLYA